MNDLSVFDFESQPIRAFYVDEEPWFVAIDVCRVLGLDRSDKALSRLDADEYKTEQWNTIPCVQAYDNLLNSSINLINESGLYSLILTSRKPQAKAFKKWITSEVLPSIRKTGKFELHKEALERQFQPEVPLRSIEELAGILGKRFGAAYEQRVLQQNIKKFHPYFDLPTLEPEEKASVSSGERLLTPTQIASMLGFAYKTGNPNPQKVNKLLESLGYQRKIGNSWSASEKAIEAKLCDRKPVDTNSRVRPVLV